MVHNTCRVSFIHVCTPSETPSTMVAGANGLKSKRTTIDRAPVLSSGAKPKDRNKS